MNMERSKYYDEFRKKKREQTRIIENDLELDYRKTGYAFKVADMLDDEVFEYIFLKDRLDDMRKNPILRLILWWCGV